MSEPALERLAPAGPPASAIELLSSVRPGERAPAGRPRVLVNMVATIDGRVTVGGRSGPIGGDGDHAVFHGLRTIVDAVLVGTGTLRSERYGRLVRVPERRERRTALGLAEDPLAVVISRSGDIPWQAPMFEAPEQRIVVAAPPGSLAVPDTVRAQLTLLEDPAPPAVLQALRARHGVRSVLCEGGPTLNRALVADGLLDELFLTIGPLLAGGAGDALRVLAGEELPEPLRLRLEWVLRWEDELYLRYVRRDSV